MEESIKSNCIIFVLAGVILIVSVIIGCFFVNLEENKTIATLLGCVFIASLIVLVVSVIVIILKRQTIQARSQLPYKYDYWLEYDIYRCITRTKTDKTTRRIEKKGISIPNRYSLWKEGVLQRNDYLRGNEDFFHFLNHRRRILKGMCDGIAIIVTPLEIGIMTVLLSAYVSKGGNLLMVILTASFTLVILLVEYMKTKKEIVYVEDVSRILCPTCLKTMESVGIEQQDNNRWL